MSTHAVTAESGATAGSIVDVLRRCAAVEHFRSATTDELEIKNDFFRRPLRPEDLAFIDFGRPVSADTICDLPSLASQRVLRCLYDMQSAWLPRNGEAQLLERRAHFHSDTSASDVAQLSLFLEQFAFGFLEDSIEQNIESKQLCNEFERIVSHGRQMSGAECISPGEFSEKTFRFLLIQEWCLRATKDRAIAKAQACGYFDVLSRRDWPRTAANSASYEAIVSLAATFDINREPHTFWQFYLPTTLAKVNQISAMATHPESSLSLVGASFVAESQWRGFETWASEICQEIGVPWRDSAADRAAEREEAELVQRFARAARNIEEVFGNRCLAEFCRGVRAAARLSTLATDDLVAQLRWLTSIDDYTYIAQQLSSRIQREKPDIDRETFIEPREMCSTTHVHNDHRLVVIESGNMVFWGHPGMRHRMSQGEMILVPRGRLHGSSVESEKCVYHQPIIPDHWVQPLIAEAERRRGWSVQDLSA
jgi:hypothetical protein